MLKSNFEQKFQKQFFFATILILIENTFQHNQWKDRFCLLGLPGLVLEKQSNQCFKNTYVVRKGGQGGPSTIADPYFMFDPPFLTSLVLKFCSYFSIFWHELWLPWKSKDWNIQISWNIFAPWKVQNCYFNNYSWPLPITSIKQYLGFYYGERPPIHLFHQHCCGNRLSVLIGASC